MLYLILKTGLLDIFFLPLSLASTHSNWERIFMVSHIPPTLLLEVKAESPKDTEEETCVGLTLLQRVS